MFCRLMNSFDLRRLVQGAVPGVLALGILFAVESVKGQTNAPLGTVDTVTNALPVLISNFESGTNLPKLAVQPLTNAVINTNNPAEAVKNLVSTTNVVQTPAATNFLPVVSSNLKDFTNVAFLTATNIGSPATSAPPPKPWWQRVRDWWKNKS